MIQATRLSAKEEPVVFGSSQNKPNINNSYVQIFNRPGKASAVLQTPFHALISPAIKYIIVVICECFTDLQR